MRWLPPSARSYALLLASVVAARVWLEAAGAGPRIPSQALALSWLTILVLAALGWGALFLAERAGFAERWAGERAAWRWYALAVLVGLFYGVVTASGDVAIEAQPDAKNAMLETWGTRDVHQPFPASIPFYFYGTAFLEIMLRLIGLTLLTWLFGLVARRRQNLAFWSANVVVSLYEPSAYFAADLGDLPPAAWPGVLVSDHLLDQLFLANLFTGYLYRRGGVWCAVVFRYSFYLIWHIAYGGFRAQWLDLFLGR